MKKSLLKDRRVKDLGYTLGANLISLISGVVITFVIPAVLPMETEFAYLKIFTLYLGYLGFFHLGFNDGIYVNYGDYDYDTLPKGEFRSYFKFLSISQIIVATCLILILLLLSIDPQRKIIYIFLAINIVLTNITGYFDFISQVIRRFKLYSFTMILNKTLYTIGVVALILGSYKTANVLILLQTVINGVILIIYMMNYKEITFGKSQSFKTMKTKIFNNINMGFFIMLGNFVSILIIGIDRIFIERFFTKVEFALYSFAVQLLTMVYLILNGIRSVVFPYLTRNEGKNLNKTYEFMKTVVFILLGYCLSGFFIFKPIVGWILPKYVPALTIAAIIFPTILLSGEINIVTQNFYKTLKLKREYTKNSIVGVAAALITIVIAFIGFRTMEAIAISSLISFMMWEIYGDIFFSKHIGAKTIKYTIGEVLAIGLFLSLAFKTTWYIGFILYIIGFTVIVALLFKNEIKAGKAKIFHKSSDS